MTAVRGTFADFKTVKTRGQCQAIIEFPIEDADHVLAVLGGIPQPSKEQWVGVAPISGVPESKDDAPDEPVKLKGGPICKRAVMLCKRAEFQNYAAVKESEFWQFLIDGDDSDEAAEEAAADVLRRWCWIESRAELDHNPKAAASFERIELDYYASQHGETTEAFEAMKGEGPG